VAIMHSHFTRTKRTLFLRILCSGICVLDRHVLTFQLNNMVAYTLVSLGTGRTRHIAEWNTTA
jgi:hypothetical protein